MVLRYGSFDGVLGLGSLMVIKYVDNEKVT